MTLFLFRLFGVRLHLREKLFFGRALVANLLAAKRVVFLVARLAFGALGRAGCFVIHGETPVSKAFS